MYRCPKCHSTRINQWRSLEGPMICMDCGFTLEDKMAMPNPFYAPDEAEAPKPALGEQMEALYKQRRCTNSGVKKRESAPGRDTHDY